MKLLSISISLSLLTFAGVAQADDWYTPFCPSGTLAKKGLTIEHRCEKNVTEAASCPSDSTLKVDAVFKDKCEKVSEVTKPVECKLLVGEIAANWEVKAKSGADECTHKTESKGVRMVRCDDGYEIDENGGSGDKDRCVDSKKIVVDAKCDAGATHKIAGKDMCEKVTYTAPSFK